jgi:hypothetical protein
MTSNSLGLKKGQRFTLTQQDFSGDLPRHKSKAAVMGLAIDAFMKRHLADKITVPASKYETFDFQHWGEYYDIKSYASSSITISGREWQFALAQAAKGVDVFYLVFQQLNDLEFEYKGMTSCSRLREKNKIRQSQFDTGGYFFSPLVALL